MWNADATSFGIDAKVTELAEVLQGNGLEANEIAAMLRSHSYSVSASAGDFFDRGRASIPKGIAAPTNVAMDRDERPKRPRRLFTPPSPPAHDDCAEADGSNSTSFATMQLLGALGALTTLIKEMPKAVAREIRGSCGRRGRCTELSQC